MSADNCVQCDKGCSEVRVIDDKEIDNEKLPLLNNPAPTAKRKSDLSDLETLMHLLKASLGTGILAMPMAFKNAGLLFGLFGTFFIGYICTYCVHMFVKCAQILCQKRQLESIGFRKIVELAFLEGPPRLRKYSKIAGLVIITAILMELLGCCCAYVVFVAKSVKQVVDHYGGHDLDVRLYMLALLPCLIIINLLRKLKYITPFSVISNSLFIGGVLISYYYIFDNLPSIKDRPFFSSWHHLPKFFGTTIFALEGIGVMMPLENSMKTPKHFIGCPGVLNTGMIILVALYSITGFFGYLKYGSNTEDSITFNIPTGELLGQSLKIVIAIGIFLTYSLLFYASMDLFRDSFAEQFRGNKLHVENLFRIFIITATVAVAAIFPNLSPFLTLVGALSLSTVGLIFPPIIETLVYWQSPGFGLYWWRLWKNLFIVLFGFLGLVTGTMTSIAEFAQTYKHPDK